MITVSNTKRLLSLDVFRGITIAGMILVNNPGSMDIYPFLEHGRWNQWTLADLVFPFFLFIVGVVIPFSISNRLSHSDDRNKLYIHIIIRTIILFGLGLFVNNFPYISLGRIPGVLQRIALCYFFSSIAVLKTSVKGQAVTIGILLSLYWALMKLVPVPGYGPGIITSKINLAYYIDNLLMHERMLEPHMDPEGLLSTMPAIATTLLGVMAGHLLYSQMEQLRKTSFIGLLGLISVITGLVMDIWFPINKNLWSPSYTVFTAGIAFCCLSVCYWLIDVRGYRRWCIPFVVYGTNAITVYVLSSILARSLYLLTLTQPDGSKIRLSTYIFERLFASWASPFNASLFYALTYALIWFGFAAILYNKRIFIKI